MCVSWLLQSPLPWHRVVNTLRILGRFQREDLRYRDRRDYRDHRDYRVTAAALLGGLTACCGAVPALSQGDQECSVIAHSAVIPFPVQPDLSSFLCWAGAQRNSEGGFPEED